MRQPENHRAINILGFTEARAQLGDVETEGSNLFKFTQQVNRVGTTGSPHSPILFSLHKGGFSRRLLSQRQKVAQTPLRALERAEVGQHTYK